MCGIAGIIGHSTRNLDATIEDMVAAIRYRGPDDVGIWYDHRAGVGLGHARLSILDVSPEGHQPMASVSGRYVMTYNGEVYNFAELRDELETRGVKFRGHSDTEVMLAAFEEWGIDAVRRFVGMFAFGLWDRELRTLHLGRDRVGIKPLYYGWIGSAFVFGSELKVFQRVPGFKAVINRDALISYMRTGYVPAPLSIYSDVYKLSAGTLLPITLDGAQSPQGFSPDPACETSRWKPIAYWSARAIAEAGVHEPFNGTESEAVEELERLLREAIRLRMISDVPLGAFLSGGIDSSSVVALMQAQSGSPVRTFSIGFHEPDYNEADHAGEIAKHLRTDHTELYVTSEQAMAVIPQLPVLYDEPFADSSQIPTFLVSQLARRHVTVALSGDGGDELFGGYSRYFVGRQLQRRLRWIPLQFRKALIRGIHAISPSSWSVLFKQVSRFVPAIANPGDKLHKLAEILSLDDPDVMYLHLVSQWKHPGLVVLGDREPLTILTDQSQWARLAEFTLRMMSLDLMTYLPDDILTKIDRASMAVGLEARVPLLDHRLVEFAWRLPLSMKIKVEGEGKWILRQVLHRYVPQALVDRPKMGFGVPIDHWLRGPLREWAEELLNEKRLRSEGYLQAVPIREKWTQHLSGRRNWQYPLWNVLMFQAWLTSNERSAAPVISHH
jgi:asparagine synthase (glutamine-hydrolysing)